MYYSLMLAARTLFWRPRALPFERVGGLIDSSWMKSLPCNFIFNIIIVSFLHAFLVLFPLDVRWWEAGRPSVFCIFAHPIFINSAESAVWDTLVVFLHLKLQDGRLLKTCCLTQLVSATFASSCKRAVGSWCITAQAARCQQQLTFGLPNACPPRQCSEQEQLSSAGHYLHTLTSWAIIGLHWFCFHWAKIESELLRQEELIDLW